MMKLFLIVAMLFALAFPAQAGDTVQSIIIPVKLIAVDKAGNADTLDLTRPIGEIRPTSGAGLAGFTPFVIAFITVLLTFLSYRIKGLGNTAKPIVTSTTIGLLATLSIVIFGRNGIGDFAQVFGDNFFQGTGIGSLLYNLIIKQLMGKSSASDSHQPDKPQEA